MYITPQSSNTDLMKCCTPLQGKEVIQYYIDELMSEGITYLPPFENSHGRPRTKSASEALVANPEQTEEDGNALPIASSAIEVADVETLGARSGKHMMIHAFCQFRLSTKLLQWKGRQLCIIFFSSLNPRL